MLFWRLLTLEKDRIKDIKDKFSESYSTFTPLYTRIQDSQMYVAGEQWSAKDAAYFKKKNIIPPVFNITKKNVDVLVGIQRQNKPALKVLPEEKGDNITASLSNRMLHHSMRKGNGYNAGFYAFKEQVVGGLSWLAPYIDMAEDAINGEFRAICESTFNMFPDPHFKEIDLSDCNYVVRRKAIDKSLARVMFPSRENDIKSSNSDYKSDYFVMEETGLKEKCVIKELWERVIVPHYTISAKGQIFTITKEQYDQLGQEIMILKGEPDYAEIRHNRKAMRLAISINDEFIVYDGKSIYDGDFFPFVPVFGFYNKSADQWLYKLQGLVESLKDPQRDYNKAKANEMQYILSAIHSGWMMDKGAVDDIRTLTRGMSTPVIQLNPGKNLSRIPPLQLDPTLLNKSQDAFKDFMNVGLNAEALGFNSGAESAKAIKMKNMQGMATVGELIDNYNIAFIEFGRMSLSMIHQYYTLDKWKRILGEEYSWITKEHITKCRDMKYDLEIDDTTYSPVQKMYRLESKMQMAQYKIPGFEAEDFYDDLDLDAADRVKLQNRIEQRKQQEQMMQQQQMAAQQTAIASKANADRAKAQNMDVQTQLMGTSVLKNLGEMGVQPGDITKKKEEDMAMQQVMAQQQAMQEVPQ